LVKGASEGNGLGNAFLSHIQSVDGIFHVVRAFEDENISHEEGSVDPIRDMDIIHTELILKDLYTLEEVKKALLVRKKARYVDKTAEDEEVVNKTV